MQIKNKFNNKLTKSNSIMSPYIGQPASSILIIWRK